jgi:3-deoxy-D-manno-octulosonic-acid transferase
MDIVNPKAAIFIKYEFWLNYLDELGKRKVPTYVVSAIFRPKSIFFRPWGWAWRKALKSFTTIFVQNQESKNLLASIGHSNVVIAGDTRFDRVAAIAKMRRDIPIVERFKGNSRLFVAGSTWGPDEELLIELINDNPTIRFVIAPHEMDENRIASLMSRIKGGAVRYTQSDGVDFDKCQVMIIDTIGILSAIYRYADVAYIGGGFGVGIHNTLEAATYGIPLAFGPNYKKFREAKELIACGAAQSISSAAELSVWFDGIMSDTERRQQAGEAAHRYIIENKGATQIILSELQK